MSEKQFIESLAELGIKLNDVQIQQFKKYSEFLLEYNSHTNLTAIKTLEEIYLKHFYDSLLLTKYYEFSEEKILDIGSGAGFPGVPLKICFPNIKLTTLDSNGKKTKFLTELKEILNLDFDVVNDRAEKYIESSREVYDVVTSRAVTAMPALAEISLPFVKVGGHFIAYKGNLDASLENGLYAIEVLGAAVENTYETILPCENSKRSYAVILKKCKTDEQYPRSFEKIMKKPLQKK